jgi:NAD(P)-dependent dehydrogenase (short-subunit alcohol dehydrogenase family)
MMADMFRLDGKVAVVVGGGGSIGGAMSLGLAQYGARLGIASRNLERLEEGGKKIRGETGAEVKVFQVDVNDEQGVIRLVERVVSEMGTVDILVNAHGTGFPKEPADVLYIPPGEERSIEAVGTEPASMLVIIVKLD